MSQENLQKAKDRLVRARREMYWAIDLLNATNLKQLNLTQEEEDELFQESHIQMAEIQGKLTQTLIKKETIEVKNKRMTIVGPLPPRLARLLLDIPPGGLIPDIPLDVDDIPPGGLIPGSDEKDSST